MQPFYQLNCTNKNAPQNGKKTFNNYRQISYLFSIFWQILYPLEFSVSHIFFYLNEYIGSDIPKYLKTKKNTIKKANLFGGPHYPTNFGHSNN